jgi:ketosteroid isomerase-like protein
MKRFSSTLVIVVLASCAAESPSVDAEAEAAELMRISREWSDVAGSGDLDATLAYWADDAVMMPPGMPPLKGKQAIREFI